MTGGENGNGDSGLRRAFDALRREEAGTSPPFADLLAGARAGRRRPRRSRLMGGLLAASALAGLIVAVVVSRPPAPPWPSPPPEPWTAPTDFLLRTPGSEVLDSVPRLEASVLLPPLADRPGRGTHPDERSVSP